MTAAAAEYQQQRCGIIAAVAIACLLTNKCNYKMIIKFESVEDKSSGIFFKVCRYDLKFLDTYNGGHPLLRIRHR